MPAGLLSLGLLTFGVFSLSGWRPYGIAGSREEKPVLGGSFRFPLASPVTTLDPALVMTPAEIMITQQIFDGLTAFDDHLNIVPALARYWEISEDSRTYTFELRSNARFHNGRAVTADDCVFSIERLLRPELNPANYQYFSLIEGAADYREGRAAHVSGLQALGERRFQIRFQTPFVPSLSVLSMYCSKILPKKEVQEKGEAFFRAPIGTGPFRFAEWMSPERDPRIPVAAGLPQAVRLEANREYYRDRPYLDELIYRSIAIVKGFEDTQVNEIVDCIDDVAPGAQAYDWVPLEASQLQLAFVVLPSSTPYDDPRIRRAINYALDKRAFIGGPNDGFGPTPAGSIVPAGIPGFIPAKEKYEHSIEKARSLLRDAGYPEGRGLPPLEFLIEDLIEELFAPPWASERRGCFESCMRKIGLKVKWLRKAKTLDGSEPELRTRPILLWREWIADFPDPDSFLRPLFHSKSPSNVTRYRNREVDGLLDTAWSETSQSARIKLYREVEKRILKDSPIVPIYYGRSRVLVSPNVRGFSLSPLGLQYSKTYKMWLANQPHPAVPL